MIRTLAIGILSMFILPAMLACDKLPDPVVPDPPQEDQNEGKVNNDVASLREASITYEANDYGGFEKVGSLGRTLPTSDTQITTQAGDVILYSGNQIVLFYGSNTWSYTRLGKMQYESLDELKSFLKAGEGNISVTLSL